MDRSSSHPIDASGSPVAAIDAVVSGFALDPAAAGHGPPVVRYDAHPHDHAWRCTVGALRAVLAPLAGGTAVIVCPAGVAVPSWADAPLDPALDAAVTARAVTDAVKQVDGGLVVTTVDRAPLRWVTGPALVRRDALLAALAGHADHDVVEPLTLLDRIGVGT